MAHTKPMIRTNQEFVDSDTSNRRVLTRVAATGAGVGLAGWLLSLAVSNFFIVPVFCRSADSFGICAQGGDYAWTISFIVVSIVAVFALVRLNVYRPLLVVLAAFVALIGIAPWLAPLAWYWAALWNVALFGLAYAVFAWLATMENFLNSLIATIVVVILARLALIL